jgi:hypothetical protein
MSTQSCRIIRSFRSLALRTGRLPLHPASAVRRAVAATLSVALLAVLLVPVDASASGSGKNANTRYFPVSVKCSGSGQDCRTSQEFMVKTGAAIKARFVASGAHCSDIRIIFTVNERNVAMTGLLKPGAQSRLVDLGEFEPGTYYVGVTAQGIAGGCNNGTLGGFTGTLIVVTSSDED